MPAIFLRSHVGRDLLQTAGLFADVPKAVWEYVVNGLEYLDHGTTARVDVVVDRTGRRISISDNGRGMDLDGLKNYFILHGENIDRRAGRPGRGRFGTGKSAAFGIAECLRVTSARNGKRCIAELSKREVRDADGGEQIPVRLLEDGIHTTEANGTLVEITGVNQRAMNVQEVVKYFERQLCYWPRSARVTVNGSECVAPQPSIRFEREFKPEGDEREIGDVVLKIAVSNEYLDEHRRGIAVSSSGVLHEVRPVESNRYVFGSVDVPFLDSKKFAIPPFDASRSLRLNPNNPLVQQIHSFVDRCSKEVCKEYDSLEKKKRQGEESKKLEDLGNRVSKVLNRHFSSLRNRPPKSRSTCYEGNTGNTLFAPGNGRGTALVPVGEVAVNAVVREVGKTTSDPTKPDAPPENPTKSNGHKFLDPSESGGERAHHEPGVERPRQDGGGFRVQYQNAGTSSNRAKYVAAERTIFVNLDHPQLAAALRAAGVDSPNFQRFAYGIAFSEYALGLALDLANEGYLVAPVEITDEIRETMNWLSREANT